MQSLRFNLIAPFIIGTLILILCLAGYTYISGRQTVEDATVLIAEAQVNQTNSSIRILFNSMDTNVQNMVGDPQVINLFTSGVSEKAVTDATRWLMTLTSGNEYYREIFILDKAGICLVSSNPSHIGVSYAEDPYIQEALKGRFNFAQSTIGKVTLRFSASIAGPITVHNKLAGVLVIQNDFPKIVDYTRKKSTTAQTISTSMLAPNGLFSAHENKRLMSNDKFLFPELYQELSGIAKRGGAVSYALAGIWYIGYAKLDPSTGWIIISSGEERTVLAPAYKIGLVVLAISCFFLCLITFIVMRFANGILRSLLSLIGYAKQVSEGHFEIELGETPRKDELGVLHNALQRLVISLQATLVETQKASRMKGQFLANMSHEIRTPLNAIIGMAHLTLREGNLSARVHDFTTKIQLSAHSLLGLLNDILDISKVEAGMLDLETIPINLEDVVKNVLLIQQEQARAKGLVLAMEFADDMPLHYLGDPLRIGQILNNLLGNAIKFTLNGTVTVTCSVGAVPESYEPDTALVGDVSEGAVCVHICVQDTGIGMSEQVIDSLFKPFMQADASTTRQFGGTGLGLAISEHLVKLLHGAFTVTSKIDEGTKFSFFIQLVPTKETIASIAAPELATAFANIPLLGKTILVAEDNQINQIIMKELLSPTQVSIILADNGQEAVDILRQDLVDLVFMDLQMPILDGFEATLRIREFADTEMLPIIAVTANAMKEDQKRAMACGMNSYITKPIDPTQLLDVLQKYFT